MSTTFNLPLPTANAPEGKVFDFWYIENGTNHVFDSGVDTKITSATYTGGVIANTTFVAAYKDAVGGAATKHTVTFYLEDGTTVYEKQVVEEGGYGAAACLPIASSVLKTCAEAMKVNG